MAITIQQSGPIAEQGKILHINTGLLIKLFYKLSNFILKPQPFLSMNGSCPTFYPTLNRQ